MIDPEIQTVLAGLEELKRRAAELVAESQAIITETKAILERLEKTCSQIREAEADETLLALASPQRTTRETKIS